MYEIDLRVEHNNGVWLVAELDLPVPPARAFEEVATAEGISTWFATTSLEPQVGGKLMQFEDGLCEDDDAAICGEVTVYEVPNSGDAEGTFAWVERDWMGPDTEVPDWITRFEISPTNGAEDGDKLGSFMHLRSGFATSNELADTSVEQSQAVWRHNLLALTHRLAVFPDGRVRTLQVRSVPRPGSPAACWESIATSLGMTSTTQAGDAFAARGAQGTVIDVIGVAAVLALSSPAIGTLGLSVHPAGASAAEAAANSAASLRFTEFVASSSDAPRWEAADWTEWLEYLLG